MKTPEEIVELLNERQIFDLLNPDGIYLQRLKAAAFARLVREREQVAAQREERRLEAEAMKIDPPTVDDLSRYAETKSIGSFLEAFYNLSQSCPDTVRAYMHEHPECKEFLRAIMGRPARNTSSNQASEEWKVE